MLFSKLKTTCSNFIKLAQDPRSRDERDTDHLSDDYYENLVLNAEEDKTGKFLFTLTPKDFEGDPKKQKHLDMIVSIVSLFDLKKIPILPTIYIANNFKEYSDITPIQHVVVTSCYLEDIIQYLKEVGYQDINLLLNDIFKTSMISNNIDKFVEVINPSLIINKIFDRVIKRNVYQDEVNFVSKYGNKEEKLNLQKLLLNSGSYMFLQFTLNNPTETDPNLLLDYLILNTREYEYFDENDPEKTLDLLSSILRNFKLIPDNIKNFLLDKYPFFYLSACKQIQKPHFDINILLDKCISKNNYRMLELIVSSDNFDEQKLFDYVIKQTDVEFIINIIRRSKVDNEQSIFMKNLPVLQSIIEKYGDDEDLKKVIIEDFKINFGPFKKSFNDKIAKMFSDPSDKERIIGESSKKRIVNAYNRKSQNHFGMFLPTKMDFNQNNFVNLLYGTEKSNHVTDLHEIEQLFDFLVQKKEYMYLTNEMNRKMFNAFVVIYKRVKNKTFLDMYHEVYKNDYDTLSKCYFAWKSAENKKEEFINLQSVLPKCIEASTNFAEFTKFLRKFTEALDIRHDSGIGLLTLEKAILNRGFDIEDESNQELLDIINKYSIDPNVIKEAENINRELGKEFINIDRLKYCLNITKIIINNFNSMKPVSWRRGTEEYVALKELHTDLSIINDYSTIKEYLPEAKPKNQKLFDFELDMQNGLVFEVLKYLDPLTFKMGAITDCCQRIGGAGEDAAIDSFINPLAGVLVLKHNNNIISQSYFHYIPEENGLILDNIEWSEKNAKKSNISKNQLSKIYADYAAQLKQKYPDLSYIRCGKEYNKIDNNLFEDSKLESDPRKFDVEEPYSDFNEKDHIDLLKPKEQLKSVEVKLASYIEYNINKMIKLADVRYMIMRKAIKEMYE